MNQLTGLTTSFEDDQQLELVLMTSGCPDPSRERIHAVLSHTIGIAALFGLILAFAVSQPSRRRVPRPRRTKGKRRHDSRYVCYCDYVK